MDLTDAPHAAAPPRAGWTAQLELRYARCGARTVPTLRRHAGPLRVQKGFTPEGPEPWHQVVVHPPGGIVGGDRLDLAIGAEPGAQVLLTAPGATKWYRSAGACAHQCLSIDVAAGAAVEWLPPETIVFDGARAVLDSRWQVARGGTLIATELVCLGRPAAGERFTRGELRVALAVSRDDGELMFAERAVLCGGHRLLDSPVGLAGCAAFGLLVAVSDRVDDALVAACRAAAAADPSVDPVAGAGPGASAATCGPEADQAIADGSLPTGRPDAARGNAHAAARGNGRHTGDFAVTRTGSVLLARWRGARADDGLRALRAAWAALRPALLAREAVPPRIWST